MGYLFLSKVSLSYVVSMTNRFHFSDAASGSSVAVIRATDNENDPMVFTLDSSVQDLLQIDNTGNLTLKKELDREVSWKKANTLFTDEENCARNQSRRLAALFALASLLASS